MNPASRLSPQDADGLVLTYAARGVQADGELLEPEEGQQLWLIYAPEQSPPTQSNFRDLLDAGAIYVANYSRPDGYEESESVGDYKAITIRGGDGHLVERNRPEFDLDWRDVWWRETAWPDTNLDLWVSVSANPTLVSEGDHQSIAERITQWR